MSKIEDLHAERIVILTDLLRRAHLQLRILVGDSRNTNVTVDRNGNEHFRATSVELRNLPNTPHFKIKVVETINEEEVKYDLWAQLELNGLRIYVKGKSQKYADYDQIDHLTKLTIAEHADCKVEVTLKGSNWFSGYGLADETIPTMDIKDLFRTIYDRVTEQEYSEISAVNEKLKAIKF